MKNKKRKGRRAQGQMEQKAKLDSASETTPQYDAIQLNSKGGCAADGRRGSTAILNVCTYTVTKLNRLNGISLACVRHIERGKDC